MKRRRGYTRLSRKNQVTIPAAVVAEVGLEPGAELRVEAQGGRIVLEPERSVAERRREALRTYSGICKGMYPPGYLDELRDERER